jgi:hypothetical protein
MHALMVALLCFQVQLANTQASILTHPAAAVLHTLIRHAQFFSWTFF